MDIQLVPATVDDIPGIADCACRAFVDDALENVLFPKSDAPPRSRPNFSFRVERIREALQLPEWHYVVATATLQDASPRIVGFAGWQAPHTSTEQTQKDPGDGPVPKDMDAAAVRYAAEAIQKTKRDWGLEDNDLWCVDPEFKGRGIASKLVSWGLNLVDKDFKGAYLVASPAAVGVYRRLGFEELAKVSIIKDHEGDLATLMERAPIEPYTKW